VDAFALLETTVSEDFDLATDLDRALKSYVLDEKINKTLHSRKEQKVQPKG